MRTEPTTKTSGSAEIAGGKTVPGKLARASDTQDLQSLLPLLACPNCASRNLECVEAGDALRCADCATRMPVFRCGKIAIPWLFADPRAARLEWKARYNGFLHANSLELERLRQARDQKQLSETGRRRIGHLLHAREQHRSQVIKLLAPLRLEGINWPADATDLLCSKLPKNQGLSSYTDNIFRDWAWNNGENEAQLKAIDSVQQATNRNSIGQTLTLGAGSGRLAYDLHRRYMPTLSVALDHNPFLLHIGAQVMQGNIVPLYEFPVAPLNESSFAVLQQCRAPAPIADQRFLYLLADALNPPFADNSFDTVVTPWLIDIIPHNLRTLIPQVNRVLKQGGVWVNSGSLAFFHRDESWRFSEEEVLELLEEFGFELLIKERRTVPYLKSPHSAHGRTENILSFTARKAKNVAAPAPESFLPKWILDTSLPVPPSTESAIGSSNHLLTAQVLAALDGKRNINQIGKWIARQYGLGKQETMHAVRRILVDAWEDTANTRPRDDL